MKHAQPIKELDNYLKTKGTPLQGYLFSVEPDKVLFGDVKVDSILIPGRYFVSNQAIQERFNKMIEEAANEESETVGGKKSQLESNSGVSETGSDETGDGGLQQDSGEQVSESDPASQGSDDVGLEIESDELNDDSETAPA